MQSNNIPKTTLDDGMSYGQVEGARKPVSRIVLGSVMLDVDRLPFSFALLDFFLECGGNCIDTAWVYRLGGAEKCGGAWIEKRAIRDQIVLIGPESIEELRQCLKGLKLTLSSGERRWLNLESKSL